MNNIKREKPSYGPVWSCVDLKVLMHCYYSPVAWSVDEKRTPGAENSHSKLLAGGLIHRGGGSKDESINVTSIALQDQIFSLTERGIKLMDMLQSTPLPISNTEWKDPREVAS